MKVYAFETSEPMYSRFETGIVDGIGNLWFDRATAQEACDEYNEEFQDEVPAFVVEFNVIGTPVVQ
jgi:hypothetical protein